jgi:hypothetical protein
MNMKKLLSYSEFNALTEAFDFRPDGYQERTSPNRPIKEILGSTRLNSAYKVAKKFNPDYDLSQKHPDSSLLKQYVIGKTFELAAKNSDEYKTAVFNGYKEKSQSSIGNSKDYDGLVKQSYTALANDTNKQFDALPVKLHYHDGESDYANSGEMVKDVHLNNRLTVFRGGDPHTFSKTDHRSGLSTNEKFRAVHDYFGHAIHGTQFGPKGEEAAWHAHSQIYSNRAVPAVTAETRGQNSMVNYTPLNIKNLIAMKAHRESMAKAKSLGDTVAENHHKDQLRQIGRNWNYAPQRAVVLPHEMNSPDFDGTVPKSIKHLLRDPIADQNSKYDSKSDHLGIVALSKHYHPQEWHDIATKLAKIHGFRSVSNDVLSESTDAEYRNVTAEEFHSAIKPSIETDLGGPDVVHIKFQ